MKNWLKNGKIKWSRERGIKPRNKPRKIGRIDGLLIYDKAEKTEDSPLGLCGSIEITSSGFLQIWTNGKYQFIPKKTAIVLLNELLNFYGFGLEQINQRITKLENKGHIKQKTKLWA